MYAIRWESKDKAQKIKGIQISLWFLKKIGVNQKEVPLFASQNAIMEDSQWIRMLFLLHCVISPVPKKHNLGKSWIFWIHYQKGKKKWKGKENPHPQPTKHNNPLFLFYFHSFWLDSPGFENHISVWTRAAEISDGH